MKSEKGITLAALVITVIIMLILTTVSLKVATDDEGIIKTARTQSEQAELSMVKSQILNKLTTAQREAEEMGTRIEEDKIRQIVSECGATLSSDGNLITLKSGRTFYLSEIWNENPEE